MAEIDYELLQKMIDCVKREVGFRFRCYPKWVAAGKMTEQKAQEEKFLMVAVQKALQKIYDGTAPLPVQQSFLNAQDYIKPKDWHG